MNTLFRLVISGKHHSSLVKHLFPGDGLEAAAILLCSKSSEYRLLVKDVIFVLHDECKLRLPNKITWPGTVIEDAIDKAEVEGLSIILMHSHPGGLFGFSEYDDESDLHVMPSLFEGSMSPATPHGSAIMTPDGAMRGRLYKRDLSFENINTVICASDDIELWRLSESGELLPRPMAFSSDMRKDLHNLSACIIGVSGTGSIVAEQAARLGFGRLILIDFDCVEIKNLNRIINSTIEDAEQEKAKVTMFAAAVKRYRKDIDIQIIESSISCREAIKNAGMADVLFCCVDSFEGRQVCDRIASSFLLPLFDVAVTIPTRQSGSGVAIGDICGRIDYVKPGGSTLFDRGVYTPESLRKEYLHNVAPEDHDEEIAEGYIKGVADEAPSVITLNMRASSACMMEFIARCYPFRHEPNAVWARTLFSLAGGEEDYEHEDTFNRSGNPHLGRGLLEPLLGMPCFSKNGEVK